MTPFLKQVAEAYLLNRRDELIDYCFVFPNKRCSTFFNNYLSELSQDIIILPETTDIDALVMSMTQTIVMPRIEQLFVLFKCYEKIVEKNGGDVENVCFDAFLPWGEMVLNDFNDVDRYLVDADEIFKNVKYFREISANFLTEEQVEQINRYWRDPIKYSAEARMWRHIEGESVDDSTKRSFFSLWMILAELYHNFRKELESMGVCYSGMAYKKAVEDLKNGTAEKRLPFKKYIFVGFNALSASEEKIFEWFRDNGRGDFYWDFASPAFRSKHNPAVAFVGKNKERFPSDSSIEYDFEAHEPKDFPEITIIGVPSGFGQVKKAAEILSTLKKEYKEEFKGVNARETAVVLPEENLCVPLVHSLPEEIRPINITMGYPMKNTPVASLIANIIKLRNRSRKRAGELTFFYQDVEALLSHPLVRTRFAEEADEMVRLINRENIFNFPYKRIVEEFSDLTPFFISADEYDMKSALNEVRELLYLLKNLTQDNGLDHAFVLNYINSLDSVCAFCEKYEVRLAHDTIFHLLNRLAGGETAHFEGRPLEGIQIMGLLETRAIDFSNLIMLSMNENIFPRKIVNRSFIPLEMRASYKLATIERQEAIFAYYFYRLITRCKRVFLLYDTRGGSSNGEMSRYIYQLLYAFPEIKIKKELCGYALSTVTSRNIEIDKRSEIKDAEGNVVPIYEIIERFRKPDSGYNLSPSSISTFIDCPLSFFMSQIAKFNINDDMKDYVDSSVYGTIVHNVFEKIYPIVAKEKGSAIFSHSDIRKILQTRKDLIEHLIVASFLKNYYKKKDSKIPETGLRLSDLNGEAALLGQAIYGFIRKTLQRESEWGAPQGFEFIKGEKKILGHVKFSDTFALNIKGVIDRLDRVYIEGESEPVLRMIDYKTGSEPLKAVDIENLFEAPSKKTHRAKGIMQLMTYCNAYARLDNFDGRIIPMIYNFNELTNSPINYLTIGDDAVTDYRADWLNTRFNELLEEKLSPLFNIDTPFTMATNPDSACKYCSYADMCGREKYRK